MRVPAGRCGKGAPGQAVALRLPGRAIDEPPPVFATQATTAAYRGRRCPTEHREHLDMEETRHNQALWAAYSDAELQAMEGRILAGVGPQEMSLWLRWLIPALNPTERAQLIAGMPPAAQAPVLDTSRALLDDVAWAKLCRALDHAPVPGLVEV